MIGDALDEIFDEGKYKREDLFITTKVWPTKNCNALDILRKSLKELRLTYVDLFLVHWPALYSEPPAKIINKPQHIIWYEMEECLKQRLTRSIGVSNYNV
jgi:diketogulonate reductase-like aldo/keto reductase